MKQANINAPSCDVRIYIRVRCGIPVRPCGLFVHILAGKIVAMNMNKGCGMHILTEVQGTFNA